MTGCAFYISMIVTGCSCGTIAIVACAGDQSAAAGAIKIVAIIAAFAYVASVTGAVGPRGLLSMAA